MKKKGKYRSPMAEAMHKTVRGMYRVGVVDKQTMREFDVRCLINVGELTQKKRGRRPVTTEKKAPPSR